MEMCRRTACFIAISIKVGKNVNHRYFAVKAMNGLITALSPNGLFQDLWQQHQP